MWIGLSRTNGRFTWTDGTVLGDYDQWYELTGVQKQPDSFRWGIWITQSLEHTNWNKFISLLETSKTVDKSPLAGQIFQQEQQIPSIGMTQIVNLIVTTSVKISPVHVHNKIIMHVSNFCRFHERRLVNGRSIYVKEAILTFVYAYIFYV